MGMVLFLYGFGNNHLVEQQPRLQSFGTMPGGNLRYGFGHEANKTHIVVLDR